MKVTPKMHKRARIYKCPKLVLRIKGKKIRVRRPLSIKPIDGNYWFYPDYNQWGEYTDSPNGCTSLFYAVSAYGLKEVFSIKAAKRRITKWDVPKGTKFLVHLPFVGHEFIITK